MGDRSLLLQISNHHAARCGTPPRIEERSGQYLGYFEDKQHVYPLPLAPPSSPLAPSPRLVVSPAERCCPRGSAYRPRDCWKLKARGSETST